MATKIVFALRSKAAGEDNEGTARSEQFRVEQEPSEVIAKLAAAKDGFVELTSEKDPTETVWINREHIRMVRPA